MPENAVLSFGLAARPLDVPLALRVESGGSVLHQERERSVGRWSERRVSLAALGGRQAEIRIHVEGALDMVAIGEPTLLAPEPAPGNLIVYVVDCLRADRVGAFGNTRGLTPNIDRLAGQGVAFERAYACAAWTRPAVGCMLTGQYPVRHGARSVGVALRGEHATLAERLQRSGHATAAVVANPVLDGRSYGFARGIDAYVELAREWKRRSVNDTPADAAQVTDAALAWIETHRDRPFFLYLHSIDLHYPYLSRAGFESVVRPERTGLERDSDLYDSELAYTDHEVGRLLQGLQRLRLTERTAIVLTADHGEEFGERGNTRHGRSLFDTLLRVPLVVRPAGAPAPRRVRAPVGTVDLTPTVLGLLGRPVPGGLDGVSLQAALQGAAPPSRALFAEQVSGNTALYAVRSGRYKLLHEILPNPRQLLFDLEADPGELRDISATQPEQLLRSAELLRPFLLAGQEGLHIVLADPEPGQTLRVGLSTSGRITDVLRLTRRTGDTLEISPEGRTARFVFGRAGVARHIVLHTQPVGATVSLDLGAGFAPAGLQLGDGVRRATTLPCQLVPADLRVAAPAAFLTPGARAWAFAILREGDISVERPELQEQMRALGYVR